MKFFEKWLIGAFVTLACMIVPQAFACEAVLNLKSLSGFVAKGKLGQSSQYVQHVYAGEQMSFSTIVFPPQTVLNKHQVMQGTAESMASTVLSRTKNFEPKIMVLNEELLPQLDSRLVFLSYAEYGSLGEVNLEATSVIQIGKCWAILRFTALAKKSKEESLNRFADLIRATKI
jgi:hypothetical protein